MQITNLSCEYRSNPLGIDIPAPRLSWQLSMDRQGGRQTSYQLVAASSPDCLAKPDVWDSGRVNSDQSVHVHYEGPALRSRQRVYWQVTVWDEIGTSATSEPAWFELGLLDGADWKGQWIGGSLVGGPRSTIPIPYMRKSFTLPLGVRSARLYVTALGLFECSINGQIVGEDVLAPGWTDFHKRVRYLVYDVTSLLIQGENVMGALLGDGWAVGHVGWNHRQLYQDRPWLLAQLEATLDDGSIVTIATDGTWKHHVGPLLESDLLMGEAYDARLEMPGWDRPGFDDQYWTEVEAFGEPTSPGIALVATNGPTVRRMHELKPIVAPIDKSGFTDRRFIFDLGQNMVGWVRFKGSAPAGTTITLKFAEVLNPNGTLYTTNLRTARATDYFTFGTSGEVVWEPKFTFHGFRYVQLSGYPGEITDETITGVVVYSNMPQTGDFSCSDPLLNQLQSNIKWGQRGNFVDVPTDCPQRDERLGWTGDIQVFVRTAAFNMNVAGFMTKWAQDVADAQTAQGAVPSVVPYLPGVPEDGGPAWADAAIICPWTIFLCYGDKAILENNYATMQRFMQFLIQVSPGYIRCAPDFEGWPGFGDWLSINADTPRDLIGTAFLAYDADLMVKIANALGKPADAEQYRQIAAATRAAFAARYLKGSQVTAASVPKSAVRKRMENADAISRGNLAMVNYGPVTSAVFNTNLFQPTQTSYVLALHFDLLPADLRPAATAELVADIERRGQHLSTGFVGAPYLPHVLSNNGRLDMAYALLNQKTWPSWLYSVTKGATTIWERWDGWTEENGFQNPEMNSFNHYAYGSIGAWIYSNIAGIEVDPDQPGYKHTIFRAQPGGGLTSASATLKTLYGELASRWTLDSDKFDWTVIVPPNTTATVYLPGQGNVLLNGKPVEGSIHEVSAGEYRFVVSV